jgi:hypothetical protein
VPNVGAALHLVLGLPDVAFRRPAAPERLAGAAAGRRHNVAPFVAVLVSGPDVPLGLLGTYERGWN